MSSQSDSTSSIAEVVGGGSILRPAHAAKRPRKRRRALANLELDGPLVIVAVFASATGVWSQCYTPFATELGECLYSLYSESLPHCIEMICGSVNPGYVNLVGMLVMALWRFYLPSNGVAARPTRYDNIAGLMRQGLIKHKRFSSHKNGFIEYPIEAAARVSKGVVQFAIEEIPNDFAALHALFTERLGDTRFEVAGAIDAPEAVKSLSPHYVYQELLDHWAASYQVAHDSQPVPWCVWGPIAMPMVCGCWPADMRLVSSNSQATRVALLVSDAPSGKSLAAYLRTLLEAPKYNIHQSLLSEPNTSGATASSSDPVARFKVQTRGFIDQYSAEFLIACVRATRNLSSVASLLTAMDDVGGMYPVEITELLKKSRSEDMQVPSTNTLERARVTLDLAAMQARRATNVAMHVSSHVVRHLNFDASPMCGVEIFCVVEETICDGSLLEASERIMPITALAHKRFGVVDKTIRIIALIFLEAGPSAADMRKYALTVYICHTDDGTEAHCVDFVDMIDMFLSSVLAPSSDQVDALRGSFLFPNAMRSLAWNHIWDGATRRVITRLSFYAEYSHVAKHLSHFLRNRSYKLVLKKALLDDGEPALAKQVMSFSASFAKWRWGTLFRVSLRLNEVLVPASKAFRPNLYNIGRKELDIVGSALTGARFGILNSAILTFTQDVETMRGWGRVCSCHEEEAFDAAQRGRVYKCPDNNKSRRCPELVAKLTATFELWVAKSIDTPPSWESVGIGSAMQHSYRQLTAEASLKFDGLHVWPYLVWRLDDPVVAKLALELYRKQMADPAQASHMHRIAHVFCNERSELYESMVKHADGRGLDYSLDQKIACWKKARLDETPAERCHALVNNIISGASSSKLPWWAATERLNQNLIEYESYRAMHQGFLFERFFDSCRTVWQFNVARARRLKPPKLSRALVITRVYNDDVAALVDWTGFKGMYTKVEVQNVRKFRATSLRLNWISCKICSWPETCMLFLCRTQRWRVAMQRLLLLGVHRFLRLLA
jgi:hypothetical protein